MHNKPLQQNPGDLLLDHFRLSFGEQIQQNAAEVVRVLVGIAQLIGHGVEEEVSSLGVQLVRQLVCNMIRDGSKGGIKKARKDTTNALAITQPQT